MSVTCDECGNRTFTNMEHDYYGMSWLFTCAECGATLVVDEAE